MTRTMRVGLGASALAIALAATLQAQFRGAPEWTTSGFDAQRTAWVRSDSRLTKAAVEKGTFAFLWKAKFDNESRQLTSLTEPVLQDLLIGYRGFKTLAFVGGSADRIFAIDTDLARPYWTANLNYTASTGGRPPETIDCPGGLLATPSRRTAVAPSTFGVGGGGGNRGGSMKSAVGKPGEGAAVLAERRTPPPVPPPVAPPPPARTGDAPVAFGGVDTLWAMGSDGYLRALRVSDGAETRVPIAFVPPSARPSSLIYLEGMVYTSTSNGCGAAPNAVWAVDILAPEADRKVLSWKTGGASIVGNAGPAFGTDGMLYVALGNGPAIGTNTSAATDGQGSESAYSNAIVALDRQSLRPKDWFSIDGGSFSTSPTVVRYKDKDLIAVGANDGRVFLLDSTSLGGSDHKTPLFVSAKSSSGGGAAGAGAALATWEDDGKTRWVLAPTDKNIVAFKMMEQGGKIALEQAWQSRDLVSPLAPIVVNGLVMAASSGEYRGSDASLNAAARAQKSTPAVLYVLDATTGKELWTSGATITSFARAGLSAGGGQVYLVTYDNQLYAFGIPMEH